MRPCDTSTGVHMNPAYSSVQQGDSEAEAEAPSKNSLGTRAFKWVLHNKVLALTGTLGLLAVTSGTVSCFALLGAGAAWVALRNRTVTPATDPTTESVSKSTDRWTPRHPTTPSWIALDLTTPGRANLNPATTRETTTVEPTTTRRTTTEPPTTARRTTSAAMRPIRPVATCERNLGVTAECSANSRHDLFLSERGSPFPQPMWVLAEDGFPYAINTTASTNCDSQSPVQAYCSRKSRTGSVTSAREHSNMNEYCQIGRGSTGGNWGNGVLKNYATCSNDRQIMATCCDSSRVSDDGAVIYEDRDHWLVNINNAQCVEERSNCATYRVVGYVDSDGTVGSSASMAAYCTANGQGTAVFQNKGPL